MKPHPKEVRAVKNTTLRAAATNQFEKDFFKLIEQLCVRKN